MRRRVPVVVLAVGLALVVGIWLWRAGDRAVAPASRTAVERDSATPSSATIAPSGKRVRRLTPDDRKRLAEQIAAARAARRASTASGGTSGTTSPPALPDDTITLEQVSSTVKTALEDAIPLLAECYPPIADGGLRTAAVTMVMTSEPEIGTVIDTSELRDEHDQPLPRELDDCLRTTIESLGLPPLEQGGKLPLKYSFVFD